MSKNSNRDNFSAKVRTELAKRVAYRCSNPNCGRITVGPRGASDGSVITGIACHIFAAAPKGPRANQNITSDERSAIDNGIWLCYNCSALIDKDPNAFPPDLLLKWKKEAEQNARNQLENTPPQQLYHREEKTKSRNYGLIDEAISKVILNKKLFDFLINHDFLQPYYRPLLNDLFDLLDTINEYSDEGSPYDSLYQAIYNFRRYLASNAFVYMTGIHTSITEYYDYYILGNGRNPEDPHKLAMIVAQELHRF